MITNIAATLSQPAAGLGVIELTLKGSHLFVDICLPTQFRKDSSWK